MKKSTLPSIFNDVIGPVMRGPSSSHTAASWHIARTGIQLLNEPLKKALIEFEQTGVWASNYREQGTTLGMDGGLLGIDMTSDSIVNSEKIAKSRGIPIEYKISRFETDHTNTIRLTLTGNSGKSVELIAVSTGGGMFEIRKFDGIPVNIHGDQYHMFLFLHDNKQDNVLKTLKNIGFSDNTGRYSIQPNDRFIEVISAQPVPDEIRNLLFSKPDIAEILIVEPVHPIISGNEKEIPFFDLNSMLAYAEKQDLSPGMLGLVYESARSGLSKTVLINKMKERIRIVEEGIKKGLAGTEYQDRILHQQSDLIETASKKGTLQTDPLINHTIANITALMEAKSAMEVIVAIPTAGSCGTFGGTVKAFCENNNLSESQKIMSYFAGGMIGVLFAMGPGFSAEEHGCQVETGAAGCMTAAALVELSGGSAKQAVNAASMALQNSIGLICDPVADRVEVPCLGKNVAAGMNALSSSTMALAGFDVVIPFDQVLHTVERVGNKLPAAFCNTGKGGLAVTPAAQQLKEKLADPDINLGAKK